MPDLYGGISDLIKSIKDNGIGTWDTGKEALALLSQLMPGGRQLYKSVLGAETVIRGGDYSGNKLKYPTEGRFLTDAQAIIFGKYATQASDAYYAGGQPALSPKQTEVYETMKEQGADSKTAYDTVQEDPSSTSSGPSRHQT